MQESRCVFSLSRFSRTGGALGFLTQISAVRGTSYNWGAIGRCANTTVEDHTFAPDGLVRRLGHLKEAQLFVSGHLPPPFSELIESKGCSSSKFEGEIFNARAWEPWSHCFPLQKSKNFTTSSSFTFTFNGTVLARQKSCSTYTNEKLRWCPGRWHSRDFLIFRSMGRSGSESRRMSSCPRIDIVVATLYVLGSRQLRPRPCISAASSAWRRSISSWISYVIGTERIRARRVRMGLMRWKGHCSMPILRQHFLTAVAQIPSVLAASCRGIPKHPRSVSGVRVMAISTPSEITFSGRPPSEFLLPRPTFRRRMRGFTCRAKGLDDPSTGWSTHESGCVMLTESPGLHRDAWVSFIQGAHFGAGTALSKIDEWWSSLRWIRVSLPLQTLLATWLSKAGATNKSCLSRTPMLFARLSSSNVPKVEDEVVKSKSKAGKQSNQSSGSSSFELMVSIAMRVCCFVVLFNRFWESLLVWGFLKGGLRSTYPRNGSPTCHLALTSGVARSILITSSDSSNI